MALEWFFYIVQFSKYSMNTQEIKNKLLTYAISDRSKLPDKDLVRFAAESAEAGIDYFQIREKDLTDRDLLLLTRNILKKTRHTQMKILINDRLDIALAAGTHGVHIGINSAPVPEVKQIAGGGMIVAYSSHSPEEALKVQSQGADMVTFSPIFNTISKKMYGPAAGVPRLRKVCDSLTIPVFALGGMDDSNLAELKGSGIAGVAAISIFQNSKNLKETVKTVNSRSK